jgi:hypothetical protein
LVNSHQIERIDKRLFLAKVLDQSQLEEVNTLDRKRWIKLEITTNHGQFLRRRSKKLTHSMILYTLMVLVLTLI